MRALLGRHPNLRASILHQGLARPVQVIARQAEPRWREADLSAVSGAEASTGWAIIVASMMILV